MIRISMSMLASKGNVPDVQKVDIYFCKPGGLGKQNNPFIQNVRKDKETAEVRARIAFCVENGIVILKIVPETPLQFGVAEILSQTFRAKSMGLRAEDLKML
ncbi:hypothetical protein Tco_0500339 [Tanacetum coccineum]